MARKKKSKDSKALWESVVEQIHAEPVVLSRKSSELYRTNPKHLVFLLSRYKFCAKLLEGHDQVIELGCGDGFGSAIVAAAVNTLICTDIDEASLEDNQRRKTAPENVSFEYFDFREKPYPTPVNSIYTIDVIEHIFPEEEPKVMANVAKSLKDDGVLIIGTPNKSAEPYASEWSKAGHVNLKTLSSLRELSLSYFHNVFMFGMNDEVVHTGFPEMCHFLWALCVTPRR